MPPIVSGRSQGRSGPLLRKRETETSVPLRNQCDPNSKDCPLPVSSPMSPGTPWAHISAEDHGHRKDLHPLGDTGPAGQTLLHAPTPPASCLRLSQHLSICPLPVSRPPVCAQQALPGLTVPAAPSPPLEPDCSGSLQVGWAEVALAGSRRDGCDCQQASLAEGRGFW